jgi:GTP 3',8-cyclase
LHGGASDEQIESEVREIVSQKEKGHRINEPDFVPPARSMVFIGG